ncbi:MAG: glycosyltransferase [Ruminococcaceae bacterium]|nr:glycosyltransferase [Oscillospiraceae bacterium]
MIVMAQSKGSAFMNNNTDATELLQSSESIQDNSDIKVSVIIPIYNSCKYIRPAMDSIMHQTLEEIEIICVDDGSTDTSLDMLRIYKERDPRIRIITQTNAGPAIARNNGFRRARGEYVAFLDSDDFYEPELLERLYSEAKEKDLDISITRYDIYNSKKSKFRANIDNLHSRIYDGGVVTSKNEYPDYILASTTGAAWNKLFKRSFLCEKGITFLPDVMMFEDVYFTVTALAFAERVGMIPDILVHHRIYNEQSRVRTFKKYYAQVPFVYSKTKEFLMKGGMYHPLAKGFLNLSASRCHHIYDLLGSDAKAEFWNLLHNEYTDLLGWRDHRVEDFEKPEVCDFVANVELYSYDQYMSRLSRGRHLDKDKIDNKLDRSERRRSFRAFLKRIFGRKRKDGSAQ